MFDTLEIKEKNDNLKGHWTFDMYEGEVLTPEFFIRRVDGYNLITTVGKAWLMGRMVNNTASALTRIGVGTSATAATIGDTTLTGSAFVVFDSTPTLAGLTMSFVATFGPSVANFAWNEVGMDNGTTLFNRMALTGPITKSATMTIVVGVGITQA